MFWIAFFPALRDQERQRLLFKHFLELRWLVFLRVKFQKSSRRKNGFWTFVFKVNYVFVCDYLCVSFSKVTSLTDCRYSELLYLCVCVEKIPMLVGIWIWCNDEIVMLTRKSRFFLSFVTKIKKRKSDISTHLMMGNCQTLIWS
jgi:hypothetical protein